MDLHSQMMIIGYNSFKREVQKKMLLVYNNSIGKTMDMVKHIENIM